MHASAASLSRTARGGFLRRDKQPTVLQRPLQPVMLLVLSCAISILLASGARGADMNVPIATNRPTTTTQIPSTTTVYLPTSQTQKQYESEGTSSRGNPTATVSWTSVSESVQYTQPRASNDTGEKYLDAPSENGLIVGASVGTAVFLVAVSAVVLGLLYSQGLIGSSAKAFTPVATQPPPV